MLECHDIAKNIPEQRHDMVKDFDKITITTTTSNTTITIKTIINALSEQDA